MALALQKSAGRVAVKSAARSSVAVRAVSRPTWCVSSLQPQQHSASSKQHLIFTPSWCCYELRYPGATPPSHLDGTMLGDYGACTRATRHCSAAVEPSQTVTAAEQHSDTVTQQVYQHKIRAGT